MRIISKHKDYYDSVKAYGIDPECVYVRKIEEMKFDDINFDIVSMLYTDHFYGKNRFPFALGGRMSGPFNWEVSIIGYCGKLYPCIRLEFTEEEQYFPYESKKYIDYVYDENLVINFLKKHNIKEYIKSYVANGRYNRFTHQNIKESFDYIRGKKCEELFHEKKIPVFAIDVNARKLEWNCVLKDRKFFKVKDTFSAFQEIAGYVSGVLGGQSPKMVDISDEVMVYKKGFNDMSFRKAPTKKRRK